VVSLVVVSGHGFLGILGSWRRNVGSAGRQNLVPGSSTGYLVSVVAGVEDGIP
jgi:hypothetical protein